DAGEGVDGVLEQYELVGVGDGEGGAGVGVVGFECADGCAVVVQCGSECVDGAGSGVAAVVGEAVPGQVYGCGDGAHGVSLWWSGVSLGVAPSRLPTRTRPRFLVAGAVRCAHASWNRLARSPIWSAPHSGCSPRMRAAVFRRS